MSTTAAEPAADQLRTAMVARLKEDGSIGSPEIEAAFLAVPRERFAPEADPVDVYRHNEVVITKRGADGRATSSISAPWLQAEMLAHAALRPAERVMEIGGGGYNAALIAEVVGPQGTVTTVDIDPFVSERARRFLTETGYGDVRVVLADAADLPDGLGPFDAIIVTVGVWDVPQSWIDRLAPGGRLVVPLRFGGITRSITFVKDERGRLLGHHPTVCGFVAAQGGCAHAEQEVLLAGGQVTLRNDDGPHLDAELLERALHAPRTELWSGITAENDEPFDTLYLWLMTATPAAAGIIWQDLQSDVRLVDLALKWFNPALIETDSFAYLTIRRTDPTPTTGKPDWEFGVHGHGPSGTELARRFIDHIHHWNAERRRGPEPSFTLYPAGTKVEAPTVGRVYPKQASQLVMSWEP